MECQDHVTCRWLSPRVNASNLNRHRYQLHARSLGLHNRSALCSIAFVSSASSTPARTSHQPPQCRPIFGTSLSGACLTRRSAPRTIVKLPLLTAGQSQILRTSSFRFCAPRIMLTCFTYSPVYAVSPARFLSSSASIQQLPLPLLCLDVISR